MSADEAPGKPPHTAGEFDLIARHFAPLAKDMPGTFGLLDDAAAIAPPPGCDLVLTKDAMVAGVHFLPDDDPADVAAKLLRVNLSDLAAKGARPYGYLLATSWPHGTPEATVARFASGLAADQSRYGIGLLGGDTTATPGPLTLSLTAIGLVPAGGMVRRGGARPGDVVAVTGTIGDAALGLRVRQGTLGGLAGGHAGALRTAYLLPQPPVAFGPALVGRAHAALDVSDGLVADLGHMAKASGVRIVVRMDCVPLSDAVRAALSCGAAELTEVLTGGDDYQIAFSASKSNFNVLEADAARCGVGVTAIGEIAGAGAPAVEVLDESGRAMKFLREGYTHV
ncbi:thiamine-phosphate kinase [Futiania mangrovi]|uniref:Thiamine-monophosphate kinase n=1 Tax=Futiania mangrovi TaxID=2959716 RepID=A0A9J6P8L7_9PROT|nr:thiamine-phosphate kinase [Futiania mangrovii]MCP1336076.1 thiamine-phosphate kinase [Futiania mangrovii]